jgi:hypothetical protein
MRVNWKLLKASAVAMAVMLGSAAPALAATWIPGHYAPNGAYIPGHWVGGPGLWIKGHYSPAGYWIPGHWADGAGPAPGRFDGPPGPPPYGTHWVGGFYGPAGVWHPGHWARN